MTDQSTAHVVLRTVLWQGIWRPGAEWCDLSRTEPGWRMAGTAFVAVDGAPARARYEIFLDKMWKTREAWLNVQSGAGQPERILRLAANSDGRWTIEWEPARTAPDPSVDLTAVHGLVDIDLGFTPATNTLPIRRLAPAIGETVDVTAVWVRFPELSVQPLPQRYTRLSERHYRYESNDGAFVAALEVDELGLVVSYEGGWRRIAAGS